MGFLDKLQQTAKDTLDKGKEKLEDVQADRKADQLLRDLGAWYYAGRTGRDEGAATSNIERIVGELEAHEAEHGPLGRSGLDADADADQPGSATWPSPAAPSAPPHGDAVAPPPSAPAPPSGPVTSGPPPPPPS